MPTLEELFGTGLENISNFPPPTVDVVVYKNYDREKVIAKAWDYNRETWKRIAQGKMGTSASSPGSDTEVVINALEYLQGIGGGVLKISRGKYYITKTLDLSTSVIGEGYSIDDTVLIAANNINSVFNINGEKIIVSKLFLNGNNLATKCIDATKADRCYISLLSIDAATEGIKLSNGDNNCIDTIHIMSGITEIGINLDCPAATVRNCYIGCQGTGISSSQFSNSIINNKIYNCKEGLHLNTFLHGIALLNRIEPNTGGVGIHLTSSKSVDVNNAIISKNRIFGELNVGILIEATDNNIYDIDASYNSILSTGQSNIGIQTISGTEVSVYNIDVTGTQFIGEFNNKFSGDGMIEYKVDNGSGIFFEDINGNFNKTIYWGTANDDLYIQNSVEGNFIALRNNGRIVLDTSNLIVFSGAPIAIAGEIYSADYGGSFANFTPPTPKSPGHMFLAQDTNATAPGKRLYISIDGTSWSYVDLT